MTTNNEYEVPTEFADILDVMEMGAKKHGGNNWLNPNGRKSSLKDMHDSMFHHLAESFSGSRADAESGLDPLLHLACRALMTYTRIQRDIVHEDDVVSTQQARDFDNIFDELIHTGDE